MLAGGKGSKGKDSQPKGPWKRDDGPWNRYQSGYQAGNDWQGKRQWGNWQDWGNKKRPRSDSTAASSGDRAPSTPNH